MSINTIVEVSNPANDNNNLLKALKDLVLFKMTVSKTKQAVDAATYIEHMNYLLNQLRRR